MPAVNFYLWILVKNGTILLKTKAKNEIFGK